MIYIIGMGMGSKQLRTLEVQEALEKADIIIGAQRLLDSLEEELCQRRIAEYRAAEIVEILKGTAFMDAAILFSGDVTFYSGAKELRDALLESKMVIEQPLRVLPGISSVSYMCSRVGVPLQDLDIYSAHGQDCDIVSAVMRGRVCFFITGGKIKTSDLCQQLVDAGLGDLIVAVGEHLSYEYQMIRTMKALEAASRDADSLGVMVVWPPSSVKRGLPGYADEAFIRGNVPMTKRLIRANVVCLLNPGQEDVCWDVGAGTGSVSVELAMHGKRVYAIEMKPEAVKLLQQNKEQFRAYNMQIVEGEAPEALSSLEAPQVVFIGGSNGRIPEILDVLPEQNVRVCVTAVTLETLEEARVAMERRGFAPQVTQVAVTETRLVGNYHMLDSQNPVFIIYGER
ncbi:MAG: precorrin-6y C5,15-methyltransferase (decarboxylating) subunit CbiE [Lachnospiraceae bacterium]|nr:precorrin-6y C5,15-methyltransferase (decarboxylating) subunit CbiE [Lachnospiraceae bacterium]